LTYRHSISILGLARDAAQEASSKAPKSLIIRARKRFLHPEIYHQVHAIIAETRQTYRAVLSEPTVIFPANFDLTESENPTENPGMQDIVAADRPQPQKRQREESGPSKKKKRRQNQAGTDVVT